MNDELLHPPDSVEKNDKMRSHPDLNDLEDYVLLSDSKNRTMVEQHVSRCPICFAKLQQLEKLREDLIFEAALEFNRESDNHLSDQVIIDYVEGKFAGTRQNTIQAHVEQCEECRVSVLRFRANHGRRTEEDTLTNTQKSKHSKNQGASTKINIFPGQDKFNITSWVTMSLAAAASMVLAVFVMRGDLFNTNDRDLPTSDLKVVEKSNRVEFHPAGSVVSAAQNDTFIDWYNGYIESTAEGTATLEQIQNPVQAELLAKKAARHIAYANISETIDGVAITAHATYRNLVTDIDSLQVRTQGFIRGGVVINENLQWIKGIPKASVTVRIPLYGNKGVQGLIDKDYWKRFRHSIQDPVASSINVDGPETSDIIIDARGIEYSPALTLSVFSKNNIRLFSSPVGIEGSNVQYYSSLDQAKQRVTTKRKPVIVKASAARGSGTLVLDRDGVLAMSRLKKTPGLMGKLSVVF